jgi:hypothetical protein
VILGEEVAVDVDGDLVGVLLEFDGGGRHRSNREAAKDGERPAEWGGHGDLGVGLPKTTRGTGTLFGGKCTGPSKGMSGKKSAERIYIQTQASMTFAWPRDEGSDR